MKKLFLVAIVVLVLPVLAFAQLKSQATPQKVGDALTKPSVNFLFGFINPERFEMHHSFSMSYMTMGGNNLMLNTYMNTIYYQFSNPLTLRLNLGLVASPYNNFQNSAAFNDTKFFGGAELLYRPSNNMTLRLGINTAPSYLYSYPYQVNRLDETDF